MDRRNFLKLVGLGLPSIVVAEKLGLWEKVRSCFFAPEGGWRPDVLNLQQVIALQLEALAPYIAKEVDRDRRLYDYMVWNSSMTVRRGKFRAKDSGYNKIEWDKALILKGDIPPGTEKGDLLVCSI